MGALDAASAAAFALVTALLKSNALPSCGNPAPALQSTCMSITIKGDMQQAQLSHLLTLSWLGL